MYEFCNDLTALLNKYLRDEATKHGYYTYFYVEKRSYPDFENNFCFGYYVYYQGFICGQVTFDKSTDSFIRIELHRDYAQESTVFDDVTELENRVNDKYQGKSFKEVMIPVD